MQPILRQSDQWPERAQEIQANTEHEAWGPFKKQDIPAHPKPTTSPPAVSNPDVRIMPGQESGLYGEDEDHPYDAIVTPSPHGGGYDVIKPLG